MAIGLSRLFGVTLPLNFHSPYRAVNIIEFWRRWHMTLSRFLRDYLYVPLGGNRKGPARRYLNLLITMVLGGLWHGAGWTFVLWGALHGAYLAINHGWQLLCLRLGQNPQVSSIVGRACSILLTFVAVVVAWVVFRAPDLDAAVLMLKAMAGVNIVRIPYKSGAQESADLISGQVQLMFARAGMTPHVRAGRLRALAVTSVEPSPLFPELPTIASQGLPGYESGSIYALFAPAGTPAAIVQRLHQESVKVLQSTEVRERFLKSGMEAVGSTPEELAATIKSDIARIGKLIKDAGIRE
jgi:hypothetical protein